MFCLPRRSSAGGGHVNRASSFSLILLSVLAPALSIGVPITPGHKSHKRTSDFPTSKATLHPGPCYGTQATARALVGRGRKHRHVHATFFFFPAPCNRILMETSTVNVAAVPKAREAFFSILFFSHFPLLVELFFDAGLCLDLGKPPLRPG